MIVRQPMTSAMSEKRSDGRARETNIYRASANKHTITC